jgi:aminoglycoside phosphotransferase
MSRMPALGFDPAVPQRDRLIDLETMRNRLAALTGTREGWNIARVKYQVGRSLRVVYRRNDDSDIVAVRTLAPEPAASTRLAKKPEGRRGLQDADLGAILYRFPEDRRIEGLQALLHPDAAASALLAHRWTKSRLAGYAPEKCAVVACFDDAGQRLGYAKLYAEVDDAARALRIADLIGAAVAETRSPLLVPRPIAADLTRRLIVTEAAPGRRASDLTGAAALGAVRSLGTALAAMHNLPISLDGEADDHVTEAVHAIGVVRPDLGPQAQQLAAYLASTRPASGPVVPRHGDVHLKNALVDGSRLWLIDLDQAIPGPAAADLGSFLAVLQGHALTGAWTERAVAEYTTVFLEGYAGSRPLPAPEDLRWHIACALLSERALRGVSRMRGPILARLPYILHHARNLAGGLV